MKARTFSHQNENSIVFSIGTAVLLKFHSFSIYMEFPFQNSIVFPEFHSLYEPCSSSSSSSSSSRSSSSTCSSSGGGGGGGDGRGGGGRSSWKVRGSSIMIIRSRSSEKQQLTLSVTGLLS